MVVCARCNDKLEASELAWALEKQKSISSATTQRAIMRCQPLCVICVTLWQIDEEAVEMMADYFLLVGWGEASKSLQMVTVAMKLKDAYSLEGKL